MTSRKPNWSSTEISKPVEEISPFLQFLNAKFSSTITNEKKNSLWETITDSTSSPLPVAVSLFQTPNSSNSRSQVALSLFQTPVVKNKSNIESPVTPALRTFNQKPVKRSLLDDSGYISSPTCPSPIAVSIMPSPVVKQTNNCYSKSVTSTPKPKSAPVRVLLVMLRKPMKGQTKMIVTVPSLSKSEKAHLASLLQAGGYISHVGDMLLKNKDFFKYVTNYFKTESEEKMKILNKEKHEFVKCSDEENM
ncbi:unnamed protein product [Mytilus coruscus]|uniref:Myb/SANT-like DNA-binding domain-containing protein n=1 Tax=Mytilus coruscus TaxID=42192 RepID=A0A6J8ACR7_MYTCO|nr:unnamed protein product [Mytilus coruscus]